MKDLRPYKVYAIKEGVVVDHIPPWSSLKIIRLLGLDDKGCDRDSIITLGVNLESNKHGRKDVLKIENKELTREELNKISLVAETATVNIINGYAVAEKVKMTVPNIIIGLISCSNDKCITNHQPVKTRFDKVSVNPLKLKCHHCERLFSKDELIL